MTAFQTYTTFMALRKHFTTKSYDFIKYRGGMKLSKDSFDKRKDKIFFDKLSKHNDCFNYILSNLIANPNVWIRDLAYSQECNDKYIDWLKRTQALRNTYKNDLAKLCTDFNANFISKNGYHPTALSLYFAKEISIETFCILIELSGCVGYWNKAFADDPVWAKTKFEYEKYMPFIRYDRATFTQITVDYFSLVSINSLD